MLRAGRRLSITRHRGQAAEEISFGGFLQSGCVEGKEAMDGTGSPEAAPTATGRGAAITQSPGFCLGLLEAAPDAIIVVDDRGAIVLVNAEAERMFGYTRHELLGQAIEILIPERARALHAEERSRFQSAPPGRTMGGGFEVNARRKDGSELPVEVALSPLVLSEQLVVIGIVRDISQRKGFEANLWFLSTHDALTGLYNRSYFEDRMVRLEGSRQYPISVLLIDVDGLKEVNDTRGHAAGDELLKRTARKLLSSLRSEDVIARIGGDEFAVLLPATHHAPAVQLVERLRMARDASCKDTEQNALRFSVGVATGLKGEPLAEVLRRADVQMYQDKLVHGSRASMADWVARRHPAVGTGV